MNQDDDYDGDVDGDGHYEKDAFCVDAGVGGIVCGPSTAGAMETFTVKTVDAFTVLRGPREDKYCLHEPDHFPKCIYDADSTRMTRDYAPFSLTRSADNDTTYAIRLGSSGYCTSGVRDILHCNTSWMDKWETFKVTCA